MPPLRTTVTAATLAALLLTGCVGDSSYSDAAEPSARPEMPAVESGRATDRQDRALVTSARLLVELDDPVSGASALRDHVEQLGGHLADQQVSTVDGGTFGAGWRDDAGSSKLPPLYLPPELRDRLPDGATVAQVRVQVPAGQLDAVLDRLRADANVHDEARTASDVTDQLVDLDARLATLQRAEEQLTALFDEAGSQEGRSRVDEVVYLLEQLRPVREEIERLTAAQAHLEQQVALSTLTVTLLPTLLPADDDVVSNLSPFTPGSTFDDASRLLLHTGARLVDVGIWLAVWSVPVAAAAGLAGVARRRRRLRRSAPAEER